MALRLQGYGPQLYTDGEQALEAMLAEPCAAAVLDLRLPKIDGLTICQRVRTSMPTSALPIILLLMREDAAFLRARGQDLQVNSVLYMPFNVRELLAAVAAAVALDP